MIPLTEYHCFASVFMNFSSNHISCFVINVSYIQLNCFVIYFSSNQINCIVCELFILLCNCFVIYFSSNQINCFVCEFFILLCKSHFDDTESYCRLDLNC